MNKENTRHQERAPSTTWIHAAGDAACDGDRTGGFSGGGATGADVGDA